MKIYLLEQNIPGLEVGQFDKVISFLRDQFANVESYYTYEEYFRLYDEVYQAFLLWLEENVRAKHFRFDDVDVLTAYGKTIFDFIFNLYQKIYIFRKIILREMPTEVCVLGPLSVLDTKYPYLSSFISDFLPTSVKLRHLKVEEPSNSPKTDFRSGISGFMDGAADLARRLANRMSTTRQRRYLIYSDLQKIPKLLDFLDSKKTIFLEKNNPKRHLAALIKKGVATVRFCDFLVSDEIVIQKASEMLVKRLDTCLTSLAIKGDNLVFFVKKYLEVLWRKELPQTLVEIRQLRTLFATYPFEAVLLDEDRNVTKNLVAQMASLSRVKSFVNCHGDPAHKIGVLPLAADSILVWGHQQKELMTRWGLPDERIRVVGCTKYDAYFSLPDEVARKKVYHNLKLDAMLPLILVATCPLNDRRNILDAFFWRQIKNVIKGVAPMVKRANIVIKLHPGDDNANAIRNYVAQLGLSQIQIIKDYDPLLLTKACNVLVVYLSTFAIDGLAYKKPVVLGARYDYDRLRNLEYFYDGTEPQLLTLNLHGLLDDRLTQHKTHWATATNYLLSGMVGKSSKQVAELLNSAPSKCSFASAGD